MLSETTLYDVLRDIRKHPDEVETLVRALEPDIDEKQYDGAFRSFCTAYTIQLLQLYCSPEETDLILMSYGFLEGYEFLKPDGTKTLLSARRERYYANRNDIKPSSSYKRENVILERLTKKLVDIGSGNLGILDKMPNKLIFPKPLTPPAQAEELKEEPKVPEAKTFEPSYLDVFAIRHPVGGALKAIYRSEQKKTAVICGIVIIAISLAIIIAAILLK